MYLVEVDLDPQRAAGVLERRDLEADDLRAAVNHPDDLRLPSHRQRVHDREGVVAILHPLQWRHLAAVRRRLSVIRDVQRIAAAIYARQLGK